MTFGAARAALMGAAGAGGALPDLVTDDSDHAEYTSGTARTLTVTLSGNTKRKIVASFTCDVQTLTEIKFDDGGTYDATFTTLIAAINGQAHTYIQYYDVPDGVPTGDYAILFTPSATTEQGIAFMAFSHALTGAPPSASTNGSSGTSGSFDMPAIVDGSVVFTAIMHTNYSGTPTYILTADSGAPDAYLANAHIAGGDFMVNGVAYWTGLAANADLTIAWASGGGPPAGAWGFGAVAVSKAI